MELTIHYQLVSLLFQFRRKPTQMQDTNRPEVVHNVYAPA